MISNLEEAKKFAANYDIVPICREIPSNAVTPVDLLCRLSSVSDRCCLLESADGNGTWARYSFLAFDPILRAVCDSGTVTAEYGGEQKTIVSNKPMDVLREIMSHYKAPRIDGLPPFSGGLIGYFSYAMFSYAEPALIIKRGNFHDFEVMLFDKVIVFDHHRSKIIAIVNVKTDTLEKNYAKAAEDIKQIFALLEDKSTVKIPESRIKAEFKCGMSKEEYCLAVERAKAHIRNGDIFQAVISRQFCAEHEGSLIGPYRVLRASNPSPYMVYMKTDGLELVCSSPETLVRLHGGRLATFPVAGSRPRGTFREEDLALEKELLCDEKELSEHNMLVDLGRNDLGKISEFGSVQVTEYKSVHRYSKIMHICSQVEGTIRSGEDGFSAIEAILPAGTLSGAPKIRACQIIEELEKQPRGIYGGALGYIDFTGNMDTCIAIRMAVKQGNGVYVQAGSGIVADSVPELEYEESENKAAAVINAILNA
ncbi:MAG: anthranilate synthase component I family protein [Clostridiales bacterium]|nr:anthranilate synthase component I family protein [Clostridiales bacterium]